VSIPREFQTLASRKSRALARAKAKFDSYWSVTKGATRSIADGPGNYVYPDDTMRTDVTNFWGMFNDVYEAMGIPEHRPPKSPGEPKDPHQSEIFAALIRQDQGLSYDFYRILEGHEPNRPDAEFWQSQGGNLVRVPLAQASSIKLSAVLRTLRNGGAHANYAYTNRSAKEYWDEMGWPSDDGGHRNAVAFGFGDRRDKKYGNGNRPPENYMIYLADAPGWNVNKFWDQKDLRLLVMPATILRYHLHVFLNTIFHGIRGDVFGNLVPSAPATS
jgi:hypothetical protein